MTRVSVASDGTESERESRNPAISADGRYVAFESSASNLVPGDTNGTLDVFVHDRVTGETTRVSVAFDGTQGNGHSRSPAISADGRYVAFESVATNLVPSYADGRYHVFVHDRVTGETTRVSDAFDGTQGNAHSGHPAISADGRYVAFDSRATNLVPDDTNNAADVFVHDRLTGETTRVSVLSGGAQSDGLSEHPTMSADGRYVTFESHARNLVPDDTNAMGDVFVHDRVTGETTRVSVASDGTESGAHSLYPAISGDGRYVAFESWGSNLVPDDTNGGADVFVHDRVTGETTRVSVASDGAQADGRSERATISADGRYVAFESYASNLVPGDTGLIFQVFVHDRVTGEATRVSVASDGTRGDSISRNSSISGDGRYVAFESYSTNLVPGDTNAVGDVFVRDLHAGLT